MSLSSALANAVSGLRATSVSADIVGANISNALNENYARRNVVLTQDVSADSGGVRVLGIARASNPIAEADWRSANSNASSIALQSGTAQRISAAIGDATREGSLESLLTRFETELLSASSRPDLEQRLANTAYAMGDIVNKLGQINDTIQAERQNADRQIGVSVARVNQLLSDLQFNNASLAGTSPQSQRYSGILDQRDALLNELSNYMDIRTYTRAGDTIAIYTAGGTSLLDPTAAELEFAPTSFVTAELSADDGDLAFLQIRGQHISVSRLGNGMLQGLFEVRDEIAVRAQNELDAFAFDFAARVNDLSIDPSRGPTDPGFITDAGSLVDGADIAGLAGRLEFNPTVDPRAGGDPRRLRDGVLGVVPGDAGNSALLSGLSAALQVPVAVVFGQNAGSDFSASGLAANIASQFGSSRARFEDTVAIAQAERDAFYAVRLENGVDSDSELQKLMMIEQAYGANAQVIQTIDELMDTLLQVV